MAKQETNVPNPTQERIRQEPQGTARELRSAYARFRFAADPALIDACAYERNALQAKYNDLLRRAKAPQAPDMPGAASFGAKGGSVCWS